MDGIIMSIAALLLSLLCILTTCCVYCFRFLNSDIFQMNIDFSSPPLLSRPSSLPGIGVLTPWIGHVNLFDISVSAAFSTLNNQYNNFEHSANASFRPPNDLYSTFDENVLAKKRKRSEAAKRGHSNKQMPNIIPEEENTIEFLKDKNRKLQNALIRARSCNIENYNMKRNITAKNIILQKKQKDKVLLNTGNSFDDNINILQKYSMNTNNLDEIIDGEIVNYAALFVTLIDLLCKDRVMGTKKKCVDKVIGLFVNRIGTAEYRSQLEKNLYRSLQFGCYDVVRCSDVTSLNDTAVTLLSRLQPENTNNMVFTNHLSCHRSANVRILEER